MPGAGIEATPRRAGWSRPSNPRHFFPRTGKLPEARRTCMPRFHPAAILGLVLICRAAAARPGGSVVPPASPASENSRIEQLERDRQDAFVRGDIEALDRATADDYTTINGTGKLSTKPQMMENLRQGKTKVLSVNLSDMKARIYGDTAVLTGDYRDVNVRDGVTRETHALFTRVFVKTNGGWQAVAYEQTPVMEATGENRKP